MKFILLLLTLVKAFQAHVPAILAIVSGLGMILTKNLCWGLSEIFQALTIVFGGASVVGLRNAVDGLTKTTVTVPTTESHS